MTWSDFYLLCFLVGFSLSVLSFLAGAVHLHRPFKMHLPFHGAQHAGGSASHGGLKGGTHISWFNASSAMAFLAWFGGTGYLLTRHSHLLAVISLLLATVAGLAAGWVVFRFMVKLVSSTDAAMKSEDYRRCAGARSDEGKAIEKGAEVVIERYEKGIAYVKRWEEFSN